jgi:release factor glutamine methyltransferase
LTTLAEASEYSSSRLKKISDTPVLDTQVLLAHILGKTRSWVLAHPEHQLIPQEIKEFYKALKELESGIPLPYVLGSWEFFSLEFKLTPDVLIPRPETELLVEQAIDWLHEHPGRRRGVDVGTGSGCIAVTLAHEVSDLALAASDISMQALRVAQVNASRHQVNERIQFIQADLLPHTSKGYDLICANLPYIPTSTLKKLKVYGREPSQALDGGADGLDIISRLLEQSRSQLVPGGILLLEIEAAQGEATMALAERLFPGAQVELSADLAGHDRILAIKMIK